MISLSDTINDLAASEGLSVFPIAIDNVNAFVLKDAAHPSLSVCVSVRDLEITQNKDNDEAMLLLVNSRFKRAVSTLRKELAA